MSLETFRKLPLGGVDRRSLVSLMAEQGAAGATKALAASRETVRPQGTKFADDAAVLILGGSNGITRTVAIQLLFGEGAAVYGVHYDSAKMQIGVHHAAAISEAAAREGLTAQFFNRDATRDKTIAEVVEVLKEKHRVVHFINGIAAGATKRYEKHGPTKVHDLNLAFDPVMQIPDFGNREAYRQIGMVEVEVASEAEIERTNKFMGSSSRLWIDPLAEAGLIKEGESVVAFCDYDFEPDDPVYAMGPLAGAKILQREAMGGLKERYGVRTVRICYPAMPTTALGAIPGGTLMYGLTAQILKERGEHQSLEQLAAGTMMMWKEPFDGGELRLDGAYQEVLPEFHRRQEALSAADCPGAFELLWK